MSTSGTTTYGLPDVERVTTTFDEKGRLAYYKETTSGRVGGEHISEGGTFVTTVTEWTALKYNSLGQILSYETVDTDTGGTTTTTTHTNITYNQYGWMTGERVKSPDGTTANSYRYDQYGRMNVRIADGGRTNIQYLLDGRTISTTTQDSTTTRTVTDIDGSSRTTGTFSYEYGSGSFEERYDVMGTKRYYHMDYNWRMEGDEVQTSSQVVTVGGMRANVNGTVVEVAGGRS